jgi:hypothetical protein
VIDEETKERLIAEDPRSAEVIKPFLAGREIKRYQPVAASNYLLFIPWHFPLYEDPSIKGASIEAEMKFKEMYPSIFNYLSQFKDKLSKRNKAETGIRYEWYALQRYGSSYYTEFEKPKIIYAEIATRGQFTIDSDSHYSDTTSYIIGNSSLYLVGILNSTLWTFLFSNISSEIRGGFLRWKRQYMENLPIRPIDPANPADVARRDRIVALVEQMLDLNTRLAAAQAPHEREVLAGMIDATDRQIDRLVYELYGLTEEEIAVVEGVV